MKYVLIIRNYLSSNVLGRKVVWIIGSSIVRWAGNFARRRPGGRSLGLQRCNFIIKWYGTSGMKWDQFDGTLQSRLKECPPPDIMIIHLGSNDLTSTKSKELIVNIECSLLRLKALLPSTLLFWSDILPRCYWHGARFPKKIEKARKRVNSAVSSKFIMEGGGHIRHPSISVKEVSLFRHDGVHLSDHGNSVFVNDIQGGLENFALRNSKVFPSA